MDKLKKRDWLFLNDIIYHINLSDNIDKLRLEFMKTIKALIPYDRASFYLPDFTGEQLLASPVRINFPETAVSRYNSEYEKYDYNLWMLHCPKCKVYRQTDYISEEERIKESLYQHVYTALGIHYIVHMTLVFNNNFEGIMTLYRSNKVKDFTDYEIQLLDILKDHLALKLNNMQQNAFMNSSCNSTNEQTLMETLKIHGLTERELQISILYAKGDSTDEICDKLFIAPATLKKHTTNIYRKCGVKNRIELITSFNSNH